MTNHLPAAVAALTLLLAPALAWAEPGKGNGNGRAVVAGEDGAVFCPPGLANRDPACVPPGQARRALTDAERAQRREERRAQRRAERQAEARAEAEAEEERALAEAEDDRAEAEEPDAASILAALLTPAPEAAPASSGATAQVTPVSETAVAAPRIATVEEEPAQTLEEAFAQAAATGDVGY